MTQTQIAHRGTHALALGLVCLALTSFSALAGGQDGAPPAPEAGQAFTVTLPGGLVEIEMLPVPAGTLARGEERTEIAPIWMAKTETTWDAYDVLVFRLDLPEDERQKDMDGDTRPTKPYMLADRGYGHAGYPAISLSAKGAEAFCSWLSESTGLHFRLPTEAEFEWAARAGSTTPYCCGEPKGLGAVAWTRENSNRKTQPVGSKQPNAYGLHDLHGNVTEWAHAADGSPLACGGSFRDSAARCGADARRVPTPAWNSGDPQMPKSVWWLTEANFAGFRIVCDPNPRPTDE